MIALLVGALLARPSVLEFVEPNAGEISIQALITLPKLGAQDMAKLDVLAEAIPKETQGYPRREMLTVTEGAPVRCNVTPDLLRIVVDVPPSKLKPGLSVMLALLREATLTQANLDAAAEELPKPDYWGVALDPTLRPNVKLSAAEAQILYHRVFRPDRVLLAVGGKFAAGEAEAAWSERLDRWVVTPEPKGYFDISAPTYRTRNVGSVTTIDLAGATIKPNDVSLPSRILALFALGTGKGASLFRLVREKHAWSYRQEAILAPSVDGWTPHLLVASIPTDDAAQRAATIRSDLLDDVASWKEDSRARAVGMAEAVFQYGVRLNPLYVLGSSPVGNSLEDRTFLRAYWFTKTGVAWDVAVLLSAMKQVPLEDLKAEATAIVATATPRILPGN